MKQNTQARRYLSHFWDIGPQKRSKNRWNTSPMKKAETFGIAQNGEDFKETTLGCSNAQRGFVRKRRTQLLTGPVAIGQGVMFYTKKG